MTDDGHRLPSPYDRLFWGSPGSLWRDRGKDYSVRECLEDGCGALVAFLANPKTGRVGVICVLHGQNHFRCCTNPRRF